MGRESGKTIEQILRDMTERHGAAPLSVKNDRGVYLFVNESWGEMAETPAHRMTAKRDDQLPWGPAHLPFIQFMDRQARRLGVYHSDDRRPQFRGQYWARYTTEKIFLPEQQAIISTVQPSTSDEFCQLANRVNERGIVLGDMSLSIKQLYLLHQLLFHVPQKQSARELGCSISRINQYLRELRDKFEVDDSKEMMCALSAHGLFPLLEHFGLLFQMGWVASDLRFH